MSSPASLHAPCHSCSPPILTMPRLTLLQAMTQQLAAATRFHVSGGSYTPSQLATLLQVRAAAHTLRQMDAQHVLNFQNAAKRTHATVHSVHCAAPAAGVCAPASAPGGRLAGGDAGGHAAGDAGAGEGGGAALSRVPKQVQPGQALDQQQSHAPSLVVLASIADMGCPACASPDPSPSTACKSPRAPVQPPHPPPASPTAGGLEAPHVRGPSLTRG